MEGGDEDQARLMPRRSARTSRPPKRFADYVMQQGVKEHEVSTFSHTCTMDYSPPTPVPRHSIHSHKSTPIPLPRHLTHSSKSIPTPRHRKEEQSKRQLLNTVLGIQEEQCRIHDVILNILQDV